MADKSPYTLSIKLSSARPDALGECLTQIRDLMSDYDQSGESTATIKIESYKEAPLKALCDDLELWLYRYKIGIDCEIGLKRPGLRPETMLELRARNETPMDRQWSAPEPESDDEVLITPLTLELPAPGETAEEAIDGELVEDEPAEAELVEE